MTVLRARDILATFSCACNGADVAAEAPEDPPIPGHAPPERGPRLHHYDRQVSVRGRIEQVKCAYLRVAPSWRDAAAFRISSLALSEGAPAPDSCSLVRKEPDNERSQDGRMRRTKDMRAYVQFAAAICLIACPLKGSAQSATGSLPGNQAQSLPRGGGH